MSAEVQPRIDRSVTLWAGMRPTGLYWPRLRSGIEAPAHTPMLRGSYLLMPQVLFEREAERTRILASLRGILGHYGERVQGLFAPMSQGTGDLGAQAATLRDDARRFTDLFSRLDRNCLADGVTWGRLEHGWGRLARYADSHITLARWDLIHAAHTGQPVGTVFLHEGLRGLLDLERLSGPVSPQALQRYLLGRAAVGDRFFALLPQAERSVEEHVGHLVRSVRARILADPLAAMVDGLLRFYEEDIKGFGRLVWSRPQERGDPLVMEVNRVVRSQRALLRQARTTFDHGRGSFEAIRQQAAEIATCADPLLALARGQSGEAHLARLSLALTPANRSGVAYSLIRSVFKKAGVLGIGALVFIGITADSPFRDQRERRYRSA